MSVLREKKSPINIQRKNVRSHNNLRTFLDEMQLLLGGDLAILTPHNVATHQGAHIYFHLGRFADLIDFVSLDS